MASQWPPKKNTAFTLYFTLYKSDGTVIANPGTITKKVSIDGGAIADIAAAVTEEDTTYGQCSVVLANTEMNGDAIWVQIKDDTTGCVPYTITLYTAAQTLDEVDTVADGIAAKTTNLPASPAAVGSAMTLTAAYDAAKTASQFNALTDPVEVGNADDIKTAIEAAGGTLHTLVSRILGTLLAGDHNPPLTGQQTTDAVAAGIPAPVVNPTPVTVDTDEAALAAAVGPLITIPAPIFSGAVEVPVDLIAPLALLVRQALGQTMIVVTDMLTMKQDDTLPALGFSFMDANETPINCAGYDVKMLVRNRQKVVVIEAVVGEAESGAVWIDEATGVGEYQWIEGDTAATGVFQYEFEFTRKSDGKVFTVPKDSYYTFTVIQDIG